MRHRGWQWLPGQIESAPETGFLQAPPNPVGTEDPDISGQNRFRIVEIDDDSWRQCRTINGVQAWSLANNEDLPAVRS